MTEYSVRKEFIGDEEWQWVTFPNGAQMIYTEVPGNESAFAHHKYWRVNAAGGRGKMMAGASSMVSTFDLKQDALHSWIGREAALSGNADPGKEKRDLGTRVHRVAQLLAQGERPDLDACPESDRGYVQSLLSWWDEKQPEVMACEQFCFHGDLGYGGQYDLRAVVDGFTTIYDYKTAKNLYPKYGAQLVAYDLASEWCGLGPADELLILQLREDGGWYEVPAFVTREEFLSAMDTRRVAGKVRTLQQQHVKRVDAERLQEAA